jgi:hypothetical protein
MHARLPEEILQKKTLRIQSVYKTFRDSPIPCLDRSIQKDVSRTCGIPRLDPNWTNQNCNEPEPKVANFDRTIMDKTRGQPANKKRFNTLKRESFRCE